MGHLLLWFAGLFFAYVLPNVWPLIREARELEANADAVRRWSRPLKRFVGRARDSRGQFVPYDRRSGTDRRRMQLAFAGPERRVIDRRHLVAA
jgi:hypothetical protein